MGCGCGGAKLQAPPQTVQSARTAPNFQNLNAGGSQNVVRSQGLNMNQTVQGTQPARVTMTRPTV